MIRSDNIIVVILYISYIILLLLYAKILVAKKCTCLVANFITVTKNLREFTQVLAVTVIILQIFITQDFQCVKELNPI